MRTPLKQTVTVFHFRVYNAATDEYIVPAKKSPRDRIESDTIRGEVLPDTGEEVDLSELDEYGRYDPNKKRAHA